MVRESGAQYPFILMNTDRSAKKGMHWWSFLDSNPKKEIFLFNSFSLEGLEEFILQDDHKVLIKILYGTDKFNKKDNKITLITLRFSMKEYEKIKNMNRLSESTIDLLHLMNQYGKKHKLKNEVIVHLVDHQLQVIKRDTCGMYQIYFYVNLFNLLENSSIISQKLLNKRTIKNVLNEMLSTDRQKNENRIEQLQNETIYSEGEMELERDLSWNHKLFEIVYRLQTGCFMFLLL